MHIFPCFDCGAAISVPEGDVGKDVLCPNCNTRQTVPAPASVYPRRTVVARGENPPEYFWASVTGTTLIAGGILALLTGILMTLTRNSAGNILSLMIAVCGLTILSLGQILLLARQTARNTWHRAR